MQIQAVRGTNDILPSDIKKWHFVEGTARQILENHGYSEIRTPIFENTGLFVRSAGESSDIVEKQMYTIPEKDGPGLTLRPEATAPVVRAFLEHQLHHEDRLQKLYYMGPMFRHERPQKGRLRQFHQIGIEVLGSCHPFIDVEVMDLVSSLLQAFGLSGARFKINTVGCPECKQKYGETLREYLRPKLSQLCPDCQRRFEKNILRVLDCKVKTCQEVLIDIPSLIQFICAPCRDHFEKVCDLLNSQGFSYEIVHKLVRGLDYYNRTIFEVTHDSLGSQDAIAAGGRYDYLVESMGGPPTGAFGFALGVERVMLALSDVLKAKNVANQTQVFLASHPDGGEAVLKSHFHLLKDLRKCAVTCEMDYEGKSFKSQFRRANKLSASYVVICGEEELQKGVVKLKDMAGGAEIEVGRHDIVSKLRSLILKS